MNGDPENHAQQRRPVRRLPAWESAVERRIREAQERGDFDDLPGRGRPIDLSSWGQGEWALAHHVLKQAGETLPWIAVGQDIDVARGRLNRMLEEAPRVPRDERPRARDRFLREAEALDKLLEEYSFLIPSRQLDRGRLPRHIAAAQYDRACGRQQL